MYLIYVNDSNERFLIDDFLFRVPGLTEVTS